MKKLVVGYLYGGRGLDDPQLLQNLRARDK